MEITTDNGQVATVNINDLPIKVLNASDTHIALQFLSLNMETRNAVVKITYKGVRGSREMEIVTQARLTVYAMKWFTDLKPVRNDKGEATGEFMTNFQKYLVKKGMDSDTVLGEMVFSCLNNSESYADNPFSVRFNKKYDIATIELVNMPFRIPQTKRDPMTGESKVVKYIYPRRRDNGWVLKLPMKYYQRVVVKQ